MSRVLPALLALSALAACGGSDGAAGVAVPIPDDPAPSASTEVAPDQQAVPDGAVDPEPEVPAPDSSEATVSPESDAPAPDSSETTVSPVPDSAAGGETASTGGGCPYLSDDQIAGLRGLAVVESVGDTGGCSWSFDDGTSSTLLRQPADQYETSSAGRQYAGDIEGGVGRWGNSNAIVLIGGEYLLLYSGPLQNPPLREQNQAIGEALVAGN